MYVKENKAKIVCTLGPSTHSKERIRALVDAGMDVVRLNFSHGTHDEHAQRVKTIREVAEETGQHIAIMQDLSGPKIRTGTLREAPIQLVEGARFTLTTRHVEGNVSEASINYKGLIEDVEPGDCLLLADGTMELTVEKVTTTDIICEVVVGGELGEHKGINVPTKPLRLPALTAKDMKDLQFGLQMEVDWVALSFVRSENDLYGVKQLIAASGSNTPVIAKIEKRAALDNLGGILKVADGVMVARGDLGVEIPMHEVPWAQKDIIRMANTAGIPVITATQMLESMIENPRPTRAEMTDIANAILDGTDAIMLSGETAVGHYPVEAVEIMQRIANAVTCHPQYREQMARRVLQSERVIESQISLAACQLATSMNADFIICCTRTGRTATLVARHRPPMPIVAVSPNEHVLRQLQLHWGIVPLSIPSPQSTDDMIDYAKVAVAKAGLGKSGDHVIFVAGIPLDVEGTTNMIKADMI
ncbi:MAG: pyruvate kinase [Candidatus Poribacteria bacterium]|nr:pyruvate kinase [Candidatus Poribacteria bacterium]